MATTHQRAPATAEFLDPVCGMTISPADAVGHVEHKGQTYIFLAFVYNALGVPVAAGLLYPPILGLLISPIWASAAMTFSSVSVIGNALRLRRVEL